MRRARRPTTAPSARDCGPLSTTPSAPPSTAPPPPSPTPTVLPSPPTTPTASPTWMCSDAVRVLATAIPTLDSGMCEVSAGVFGFVERGRLRLVLSFVWDGDAGWRPRGRCLMARLIALERDLGRLLTPPRPARRGPRRRRYPRCSCTDPRSAHGPRGCRVSSCDCLRYDGGDA